MDATLQAGPNYEEGFEEDMTSWLEETGQTAAPSEEDLDDMLHYFEHIYGSEVIGEGPVDSTEPAVETKESYVKRMKAEAALFRNMPFEDILEYRIQKNMVLTDADRWLINEKICGEVHTLQEDYQNDMDTYLAERDMADYRVDAYGNDEDAQRDVAGSDGNPATYMVQDYPIDENGNPLSADDLRSESERQISQRMDQFIDDREKLFDRIYTFQDKCDGGKVSKDVLLNGSAPVISPATYTELGPDYTNYFAQRKFEEIKSKNQSKQTQFGVAGLGANSVPIVDFSLDTPHEEMSAAKEAQKASLKKTAVKEPAKTVSKDLKGLRKIPHIEGTDLSSLELEDDKPDSPNGGNYG